MTLALHISPWLLQAGTLPDTIVTMPVRGWMDYTSGTLQLIVLVLAIVVLGATAYVMLTVKAAVESAKSTVEKLTADVRPILKQATDVATDAREVVAMLRTDVERITQAAGVVSDQMLDLAEAVEERVDNVGAVLDVVQGELEETVLSATATLRGARLGGRALAGGLGRAIMGTMKQSDGGPSARDKASLRNRQRRRRERELRDAEDFDSQEVRKPRVRSRELRDDRDDRIREHG